MARRYPEDVHAFIRENYAGMSHEALANLTNKEKGTEFTKSSMKSYLANHKLRTGSTRGHPKGWSNMFPAGMENFVRANAAGRTAAELADMINRKFGPETITVTQLIGYKKNHGITSGLDCRFKAGHASPWKGKSRPSTGRAKETQFKPGSRPHNAMEVGAVTHTTGGYLVRKIAEPNQWELVHRATWEAAHGQIPEGMMVSFKNGDKDDVSLDNLMLISNAENMELWRSHMRFDEAQLTEAGLTMVKLKIATREKRKQCKQPTKQQNSRP